MDTSQIRFHRTTTGTRHVDFYIFGSLLRLLGFPALDRSNPVRGHLNDRKDAA